MVKCKNCEIEINKYHDYCELKSYKDGLLSETLLFCNGTCLYLFMNMRGIE